MERISSKLKGYKGGNPFHESQSRTYGDDKIVSEFYPTSFYLSLFNVQHEILLGTRGSGKTVLLKMLSYSCLKKYSHPVANKVASEKSFIGFYIPLHLEFMGSLPGQNIPYEDRLKYFQFALNCSAAKSLLSQVIELLNDIYLITKDKLIRENNIIEYMCENWFIENKKISSIKDLQDYLESIYNKYQYIDTKKERSISILEQPVLIPIVNILPKITEVLGLDIQKTNWIACIDEAEFLKTEFIRSINTFIRSEKRPLIIKMATMPFKHCTRETNVDGIFIEPNGNDFDYRVIDMDCDSQDFICLTDHLCRARIKKCGVIDEDITLERFLGVVGKDDLIDYYKKEFGEDDATQDIIDRGIIKSLSNRRQSHYNVIIEDHTKVERPLIHRFEPVYFMRRMKEESSRGNRSVGWFAGATIVRRVSDGNPRRFIQIMNDIFEKARKSDLTPKNQHRVIMNYCKRCLQWSEGLPEYGVLLRAILEGIGTLLEKRVHGQFMMDGGCHFRIQGRLYDIKSIRNALELAIAYSLIISDHQTIEENIIKQNSDLRLSYLCAVCYWLPMRKGDPQIVKVAEDILYTKNAIIDLPVNRKEARKVVRQLKLEIFT